MDVMIPPQWYSAEYPPLGRHVQERLVQVIDKLSGGRKKYKLYFNKKSKKLVLVSKRKITKDDIEKEDKSLQKAIAASSSSSSKPQGSSSAQAGAYEPYSYDDEEVDGDMGDVPEMTRSFA